MFGYTRFKAGSIEIHLNDCVKAGYSRVDLDTGASIGEPPNVYQVDRVVRFERERLPAISGHSPF